MKEGMDMEKIHAVTTSLFGKGSIALLPEELKKRGLTRGLIVTDSFLSAVVVKFVCRIGLG